MFTHVDLNLLWLYGGTFIFIGVSFTDLSLGKGRNKGFIKKGIKYLLRRSTPKTTVEHLATYNFIWNRGIYRWTGSTFLWAGAAFFPAS